MNTTKLNEAAHAAHAQAMKHHAKVREGNFMRDMTMDDGSLMRMDPYLPEGEKCTVQWDEALDDTVVLHGAFTVDQLRQICAHIEQQLEGTERLER